MRVLVVHNYHKSRNGADEAAELDVALLRQFGHDVQLYARHNQDAAQFSSLRKGLLFLEPTWSTVTYRQVTQILRDFQPDIVHCHNIFPLVSPSVYYACKQARTPVVQTLHDYRLLCPISWLFRDSAVCEECIEHSLLRSIYYGCYHGSRSQTLAIALMLKTHRLLQTWNQQVDAFITLTEFARQKFLQSNQIQRAIYVRPNFLQTPQLASNEERQSVLFVGRLSHEKGLQTLLEAWHSLPDVPLKIIGDGPLKDWILEYIQNQQLHHVQYLGFLPLTKVVEQLKQAKLSIMPSIWYETFGRTIIEAYAAATPVIASNIGAVAELVRDHQTGLLFAPGDATELAEKVRYALADESRLRQWGDTARQVFEKSFASEVAYRQLSDVYQKVLAQA